MRQAGEDAIGNVGEIEDARAQVGVADGSELRNGSGGFGAPGGDGFVLRTGEGVGRELVQQLLLRGKDVADVIAVAGAGVFAQVAEVGAPGVHGSGEGGAIGAQIGGDGRRAVVVEGGADGCRWQGRGIRGAVAKLGGGEVAEGGEGGGTVGTIGVEGEAVALPRLQGSELVQAARIGALPVFDEGEAGREGCQRGDKARGGAGVQAVRVGEGNGCRFACGNGGGGEDGRGHAQRQLFGE